jgi:sulfotransferase
MPLRIHLISGLPRSGSTLLAAILRQNPRFRASISTPLADLVANLIRDMSAHEAALLMSSAQRERMVRALVEAYYSDADWDLVFDTSRRWCALLPLVAGLFPGSRVICCLRNPAWIIDSVERALQRNPTLATSMFGFEMGTVYQRTEKMIKDGFIGHSIGSLRQAWFGDHAGRLIGVRYNSLTQDPRGVMGSLYRELGEPEFVHDFDHLDYEEPAFDASLRAPGLHKVYGGVRNEKRDSILPLDIFNQYNHEFWELPEENPRRVTIL